MDNSFLDSDIFKWVILPLLIFVSRMLDVTLATLRNIFITKGFRNLVPIVGFFEVLIWLISIRQIMQHLDNPMTYLGFALGFAAGTYVGLHVESRLALGLQVLRIITHQDCTNLVLALKRQNVGITVIDGEGGKGPVKIIFTIVKRKDMEMIRNLIRDNNPLAFYSIEDIRIASQGIFPQKQGISSALDKIRAVFPGSKEK
ncbi:MAG: DUF2179 domain-containing protein [Bacteroidia bacterium]|nr:DUF2179 domain-containing protein [Bacteroidia bacterium]